MLGFVNEGTCQLFDRGFLGTDIVIVQFHHPQFLYELTQECLISSNEDAVYVNLEGVKSVRDHLFNECQRRTHFRNNDLAISSVERLPDANGDSRKLEPAAKPVPKSMPEYSRKHSFTRHITRL